MKRISFSILLLLFTYVSIATDALHARGELALRMRTIRNDPTQAKHILEKAKGYSLFSKLYDLKTGWTDRNHLVVHITPKFNQISSATEIKWTVELKRDGSLPKVSTSKLHSVISNANSRLQKYNWIKNWINYGDHRGIRLTILDASLSIDDETIAKPFWKLAKFNGEPDFSVELIHRDASITVYLGPDDKRAIVTDIDQPSYKGWIKRPALHWIQLMQIKEDYTSGPVEFIEIAPDGHLTKRSEKVTRSFLIETDRFDAFDGF